MVPLEMSLKANFRKSQAFLMYAGFQNESLIHYRLFVAYNKV